MSHLVLKCGSSARGDTNEYSDVDYVCIHNEIMVPIKKLKFLYPDISLLSLESIRRMRVKGSLFLTHLDVDGQIVEGSQYLIDSFKGFRPNKNNLKCSILSSKNFITTISWFPSSVEGYYWLLDVLYMSFRNVLYCLNALKEIYKFGFQDAMFSYGFKNIEIENMLLIRRGKYIYRSATIPTNIHNLIDINWLITLAYRLINEKVYFSNGGITDWGGDWTYDYWDERYIERAIINSEVPDLGFRNQLKNHNYNKRILTNAVKNYVFDAQRGRFKNME